MYIETLTTDNVSVIKEHSKNALSLVKWGQNFKGNLEDVRNRIQLLIKANYLPAIIEDFITYTSTHEDIESIRPELEEWTREQNISREQRLDRQSRKIRILEKKIDGYKSDIANAITEIEENAGESA